MPSDWSCNTNTSSSLCLLTYSANFLLVNSDNQFLKINLSPYTHLLGSVSLENSDKSWGPDFVGVHTVCQAVSQHRTCLADCPWGGVHSCSSPSGSTPVLPTSHCSLERDLGWTGPGRALPQRQPRSHAAAQPPLFLQPQCPGLQRQPSSRPQKNTMEKGASPWAASGQNCGYLHRFTVTTWASLASALTSLGTEHTLKHKGPLLNLTLRASTSTTGEQTLPLSGL